MRTVRTGAYAPPQPDIDEGHGVADEELFEMEHDDAANLNDQDDRAAADVQQPAYAPNQAAVAPNADVELLTALAELAQARVQIAQYERELRRRDLAQERMRRVMADLQMPNTAYWQTSRRGNGANGRK